MKAPEKNELGQTKKVYHTPVLHYYGAIRTITEDIGSMGGADGGTVPKVKTV